MKFEIEIHYFIFKLKTTFEYTFKWHQKNE